MKKVATWLVVVGVGAWLASAAPARAQAAPDKPAAPAEQEKAKEKPADASPLAGVWDGTVEAPDGTQQFTLTLKVEEGKLTGQIGNQQGAMPLTSVKWAEGKLTGAFNYVDGTEIAMAGSLTDTGMTGTMTYGGQMSMAFSAKKRAAEK